MDMDGYGGFLKFLAPKSSSILGHLWHYGDWPIFPCQERFVGGLPLQGHHRPRDPADLRTAPGDLGGQHHHPQVAGMLSDQWSGSVHQFGDPRNQGGGGEMGEIWAGKIC